MCTRAQPAIVSCDVERSCHAQTRNGVPRAENSECTTAPLGACLSLLYRHVRSFVVLLGGYRLSVESLRLVLFRRVGRRRSRSSEGVPGALLPKK
eukprot:9492031-Pyramimonas_sp.AAC.2